MSKVTSANEDQEFIEKLVAMGLSIDLGKVLEYISNNFDPNDVYDTKELAEWAAQHTPNQLFNFHVLDEWATENGYIQEKR
jgi:hypothetical protein